MRTDKFVSERVGKYEKRLLVTYTGDPCFVDTIKVVNIYAEEHLLEESINLL